jgi:hypothetical protein
VALQAATTQRLTRREAQAQGLKTFRGLPCPEGHRERCSTTGYCVPCSKESPENRKRRREQRPEKEGEMDFRRPWTDRERKLAFQALCYVLRKEFKEAVGMRDNDRPLGWPERNLEADEVFYFGPKEMTPEDRERVENVRALFQRHA